MERLKRLIKGDPEDCRSCNSACCGPDTWIVLTPQESEFLTGAGTELEKAEVISNKLRSKIRSGADFYKFKTKCGFVEGKDGFEPCSVYKNPRRPLSCQRLQVGSRHCKSIRKSKRIKLRNEKPRRFHYPSPRF